MNNAKLALAVVVTLAVIFAGRWVVEKAVDDRGGINCYDEAGKLTTSPIVQVDEGYIGLPGSKEPYVDVGSECFVADQVTNFNLLMGKEVDSITVLRRWSTVQYDHDVRGFWPKAMGEAEPICWAWTILEVLVIFAWGVYLLRPVLPNLKSVLRGERG